MLSLEFFLFIGVAALVYYILPIHFRLLWLLISSYAFYSWLSGSFVIVLFAVSSATYVAAHKIAKSQKKSDKRAWLISAIAVVLAILGYFKYGSFFSAFLYGFMQDTGNGYSLIKEVGIPLGISFYSLQAIGYLIDVYRSTSALEKRFGHYLLFLSLFPLIMAGPIERGKDLLPQFTAITPLDWNSIFIGSKRILWGLFSKMFLADQLGMYVDAVYNDVYTAEPLVLLGATLSFSLQIFFDFYGYTNIALGSAAIFGICLTQNFQRPYVSQSIAEFWHRWHISLSTWFKDYLYIPLGGNRRGKVQWAMTILAVFLLSGLWHGADWKFIVWGAIHAVFFILANTFTTNVPYDLLFKNNGIFKGFKTLFVFSLVSFAWIWFRADKLQDANYVALKLVFGDYNYDGLNYNFVSQFGILFVALCFLCVDSIGYMERFVNSSLARKIGWQTILIIDLMLVALLLGSAGQRGFIYSQF